MQEIARLAYGVSHILALLVCSYTGFWRHFPFCFLMIAVSSVLAITYNPESREWIRTVYLTVEPLAVLLRFLAALEALRYQSEAIRTRPMLLVGLILVAISTTAAVWAVEPGSSVYTFAQIRRYAQIATAVFMIAGVEFLWSQRLWEWSLNGYHTEILLTLTVKQAVYSLLSIRGLWTTNKQWHAADWTGLLVSSLCFLAWAILAAVIYRRHPRSG